MQTIQDALKQAVLFSDDYHYYVLKLHPRAIILVAGIVAEIAEPFNVIIVDKDEVTLVINEDDYHEYAERLREHEWNQAIYRLITFDITLEPTLVGFMATISDALAKVGIPIFPYAAYTRDHLLVPAEKYELAISTLKSLQ